MTTQMIRMLAKELAGEFYEGEDTLNEGRRTRSERFRKVAKNQKAFVWVFWPKFVPLARRILAGMLTMPGTSEPDKQAIYDALLKDQGHKTDEEMLAPSVILDDDGVALTLPTGSTRHG